MNYKYPFEIGFYGSLMGVGPITGYGYAAIQLIEAWQRQRVPVWWGKEDAKVAFSMCQPQWYDFAPGQLKIGYTAWESRLLPDGWMKQMNMMDEIWTPSQAVKEWFIAGGVDRNIKVLPHGINPIHYPLTKRHTPNEGPLRFLHVGGETKRKGAFLVYEAFKEIFGDSRNVELVLKGDVQFETHGENVQVIREYLSQEGLTELYNLSHFFIYPSFGEGFGLVPFQAAAMGMPTLATDWGGMKEFIKFCWPIKVEKEIEADYEPHIGKWAQPSYESLMYWMESFADSPNYFFNKSFMKAQRLRAQFNWDDLAKMSLNWLTESLQVRST